MGLKTFWAQLSGQRVHDIPLNNDYLQTNKGGAIVFSSELTDLSIKPATPSLSASRVRSSSVSRKRKSWFGARTTEEGLMPAVPALSERYIQKPRSAVTTDKYSAPNALPFLSALDEGKRKSRRVTLSRKISLRSIHHQYDPLEALPNMPVLPAVMTQTAPSTITSTTQHQARPMSMSRKASDDGSVKTKQRKRNSFWSSSNPDDNSDLPPVPALVRDGSRSPDSSHGGRRDSKGDESAQVSAKPMVHRRTYTPRNAAAGFLMSTSGATEATRKSFRKSFHITDSDELVCLTDEQRQEWEKLRFLTTNFVQDIERHDVPEMQSGVKYSNKDALAALEFGLR